VFLQVVIAILCLAITLNFAHFILSRVPHVMLSNANEPYLTLSLILLTRGHPAISHQSWLFSHRFHLESVREDQHRIRLPLGLFNKTPELDGHRYGTYIRGDVMWRCDRLNGEELSMLVINNVKFKVRACICRAWC
jgi:hypothetical protein